MNRRRFVLSFAAAAVACRRKGRARPALPGDDDETRALRDALVERLGAMATFDPKVLRAMREVPRHLFVPGQPRSEAYSDKPLPTEEGQTTSQPSLVALMTTKLELTGNERVLEIGTGSGYQTAILAKLAREVFTVEILRNLSAHARERLQRIGLHNVRYRVGDGYAGFPEHAPYDRVLVTAAPEEVPPSLLDQLADGGVMIAPIGAFGAAPKQRLVRIRKTGGAISEETLGTVRFTPLVPLGVE